MTTNEPKLWEIWRFRFAFEEDPTKFKMRPVIIAAKERNQAEVVVLSVKVTSHPPRGNFPEEFWNWDVGAEFRISIKTPELQGLRP